MIPTVTLAASRSDAIAFDRLVRQVAQRCGVISNYVCQAGAPKAEPEGDALACGCSVLKPRLGDGRIISHGRRTARLAVARASTTSDIVPLKGLKR